MSTFGTVVSGVGTIHAAGGIAATLASFSAAPILIPVALVGAVIGSGTFVAVKLLS